MNTASIDMINSKGNLEKVPVHGAYKKITTRYAKDNTARLCDNFALFEQIEQQSFRTTYVTGSHQNLHGKIRPDHPTRKEEWLCIETLKAEREKRDLGKESRFPFGWLVDYQIPLKTPKTDDNEGLGKIDLLAKNGQTATLLELKIFDSTEHPLKAFLEVYTYWKLLGGDQAQEFLTRSEAIGAVALEKAVVFFKDSKIHHKLQDASDDMKEFLRGLHIKCYLVKQSAEDAFVFEYAEEYKL